VEASSQSPLPSPRSRFTVTPVAVVSTPEIELPATDIGESAPAADGVLSSNNNGETDNCSTTKEDPTASPDYTSLIRSSPSKVIVGFDVLTT
jgi:hypothetical protein